MVPLLCTPPDMDAIHALGIKTLEAKQEADPKRRLRIEGSGNLPHLVQQLQLRQDTGADKGLKGSGLLTCAMALLVFTMEGGKYIWRVCRDNG